MNRSHPTLSYRTNFIRSVAVCTLLLSAQALRAQRPEDKALPPPPPVRAEFRFDFGPGNARDGYLKVLPTEMYTTERGYGFDFGSKPVGVDRGGTDPATAGFVTTDESPFLFSVKVPEGNYRITATLGDAQGASNTTIRTEAGHIMAVDIVTAPGKFVTRTFIANVRRPQLPPPPKNAPGGSEVHMFLAGEAEAPKLTRVGECGTATGFTQDTSPKHRAALRQRFKNTQGTDPADRRLYHLGIDTTSVPVEACLDAIVAAAAG